MSTHLSAAAIQRGRGRAASEKHDAPSPEEETNARGHSQLPRFELLRVLESKKLRAISILWTSKLFFVKRYFSGCHVVITHGPPETAGVLYVHPWAGKPVRLLLSCLMLSTAQD